MREFLYEMWMRCKSEVCVFSFEDTAVWPMEAMWYAGRWIDKNDETHDTYRAVLRAKFRNELKG